MSGLGVFRTTPLGTERIGTLDEQTGALSEGFHDAVLEAARAETSSLDELAWKAEELLEDGEPRRQVLGEVAAP